MAECLRDVLDHCVQGHQVDHLFHCLLVIKLLIVVRPQAKLYTPLEIISQRRRHCSTSLLFKHDSRYDLNRADDLPSHLSRQSHLTVS